jgi:hypothetical protein
MSFTEFTARARDFVSVTLVDRCEVRRGGGNQVYDPVTQTYTPSPGVLVWSGPCRIRSGGTIGGNEQEVGEQIITLRAYRATLPLEAVGIEVDDRVTVTQSCDPQLLAVPFRVADSQAGTDAKFRTLILEAALG